MNCFCGDNFVYGASPYDACAGPCDPVSECGSCPTIPRLRTCYTLVGTSLSVTSPDTTVYGQAFALDDYIATAYTSATSPTGWSFNGSTISVAASPACKVAFASYFCTNPMVLQNFSLSGDCGVTPTPFTPCLQRCVAYQISCLGAASVTAATSACTRRNAGPGGWNTVSNGRCFCGDNFPFGGNPYDVCEGDACSPTSECGSCPTLTSMSTCYVLTGTAMSTTSTSSYTLAQALAVDALVANGYAAATAAAAAAGGGSGGGWRFGTQTMAFADSPA